MLVKLFLICVFALLPLYAATVYTTDFIPLADRTHFHSFETTSGAVQVYDGIRVAAVNYGSIGGYLVSHGSSSWYHSGGDNGYTSITMADGSDFVKFGVHVSNGWGGTLSNIYYNYQLVNNGTVILSGSILSNNMPDIGIVNFRYLGFSADATPFDEVRLSATNGSAQSVTSGFYQALCIDSVETAGLLPVPEPSAFLLCLLSLFGFAFAKRR